MSEVETTEAPVAPDTTDDDDSTTTAEPSEADMLSAALLLDDSKISDPEGFASARTTLGNVADAIVKVGNKLSGLILKASDARTDVCASIMRANGFPDWGADTEVYKQIVQAEETRHYVKLDETVRTQIMNTIKQRKRRVSLVPRIVQYIAEHEASVGMTEDEADSYGVDPTTGKRDDKRVSAVLANPSQRLKERVRTHMDACGLTFAEQWSHFAESHETANTPPAPKEPVSALEAIGEALAGLSEVVPAYSTAAVLMTASDVSRSILGKKMSELENRVQIIEQWKRISVIGELTAKLLEGEGDPDVDDPALDAVYFDAETDRPKVASEQ